MVQNTAISNNTDEQQQKLQPEHDALTAEALARTTADGVQNTAIPIMDAVSRKL
jgi:hypothetical protein